MSRGRIIGPWGPAGTWAGTWGAGVTIAALVTVAGCGSSSTDGARPADAASTRSSPTTVASPSEVPTGRKERVTPGGVAAVVSEHLGERNIATFGRYGGEPGTVDVMVRLREGGRADNFAVTVYAPGHGDGELAELTKCPREKFRPHRYQKQFTCHQLPTGTTVTVYLAPGGFSDDNAHGHVIAGMAGAKDGSTVLAMYESYDRSAPVTVADIDKLLSDPRLTWMTDPAVNAAGRNIKISSLH